MNLKGSWFCICGFHQLCIQHIWKKNQLHLYWSMPRLFSSHNSPNNTEKARTYIALTLCSIVWNLCTYYAISLKGLEHQDFGIRSMSWNGSLQTLRTDCILAFNGLYLLVSLYNWSFKKFYLFIWETELPSACSFAQMSTMIGTERAYAGSWELGTNLPLGVRTGTVTIAFRCEQ